MLFEVKRIAPPNLIINCLEYKIKDERFVLANHGTEITINKYINNENDKNILKLVKSISLDFLAHKIAILPSINSLPTIDFLIIGYEQLCILTIVNGNEIRLNTLDEGVCSPVRIFEAMDYLFLTTSEEFVCITPERKIIKFVDLSFYNILSCCFVKKSIYSLVSSFSRILLLELNLSKPVVKSTRYKQLLDEMEINYLFSFKEIFYLYKSDGNLYYTNSISDGNNIHNICTINCSGIKFIYNLENFTILVMNDNILYKLENNKIIEYSHLILEDILDISKVFDIFVISTEFITYFVKIIDNILEIIYKIERGNISVNDNIFIGNRMIEKQINVELIEDNTIIIENNIRKNIDELIQFNCNIIDYCEYKNFIFCSTDKNTIVFIKNNKYNINECKLLLNDDNLLENYDKYVLIENNTKIISKRVFVKDNFVFIQKLEDDKIYKVKFINEKFEVFDRSKNLNNIAIKNKIKYDFKYAKIKSNIIEIYKNNDIICSFKRPNVLVSSYLMYGDNLIINSYENIQYIYKNLGKENIGFEKNIDCEINNKFEKYCNFLFQKTISYCGNEDKKSKIIRESKNLPKILLSTPECKKSYYNEKINTVIFNGLVVNFSEKFLEIDGECCSEVIKNNKEIETLKKGYQKFILGSGRIKHKNYKWIEGIKEVIPYGNNIYVFGEFGGVYIINNANIIKNLNE